MDGWPAMETGAGMLRIINEYKIKNDINGWMDRHGDGYWQGLDNNEYKIKNAIKMNRWMARHGDGCRQALDNNIYNVKNAIKMDELPWRRMPAGA